MQAKQIVARVEELVRPLCEQAGVSLWDVEFEKEGGQYMLTVTVDRPEGVNIDQCEQVSRALDPMLDEKEFDDMPSYTLCVSSAGMSRRLKRPEHFQAFMGQTVEVGFYKPMNGMKQIEGTLAGYDNGAVTLEVNGEQTVYEPKDIAAVRPGDRERLARRSRCRGRKNRRRIHRIVWKSSRPSCCRDLSTRFTKVI